MAALYLTTENFEEEVMNSDKPVLIDFWAAWCGPCRMLSPVIEELSNEITAVKIAKINVDEQPELAQKYRVMTIPTLLYIKNGQVSATSIGVITKTEVLKMIEL